MHMTVKFAVIYYSSTGSVHALAKAVAEGANSTGAEVRLLKVQETAPAAAIASNPAWEAHARATSDIPVATQADLDWADAVAFGTPTRFGNVAVQLKQFIDETGPLWASGALNNKVATGFVTSQNRHGGQESTLLALYNTFYHWGAVIATPGYTDPLIFESGGNPYGTSYFSNDGAPSEAVLKAAFYQGSRVARVAADLARGAQVPVNV
jgi:NAD(P)H dehydrogenase (quinone)